jgi:hypothetical protein
MHKVIRLFNLWSISGIIGICVSFPLSLWLTRNILYQIPTLISLLLIIGGVCSILLHRLFLKLITPWVKDFSTKQYGLWILGYTLFGFWLAWNIPIKFPTSPSLMGNLAFLKLIYFICTGICIGLLLLCLVTAFANIHLRTNPLLKAHLVPWLLYATPMLVMWGVYLLAYWPGMMSADSFDQWGQITTGIYNDHHPAFHTFFLWLLTRVWFSPTIIAITQIIILACLSGIILAYFEKLGIQRIWLWLASFIFALSPVNGTMVVTLWKDIPYSTAVMGLIFLLLKLVISKGKWITLHLSWLLLGITAALVTLLRHDGAPVVVGTFLFIIIVFTKTWKFTSIAALTTLIIYFAVTGPMYRLLDVRRTTDLTQSSTFLYSLATNASPGTALDVTFNQIKPFSSEWDCNALSLLSAESKQSGGTSFVPSVDKFTNLVRHSISLGMYDFRCMRSISWVIWDPTGHV